MIAPHESEGVVADGVAGAAEREPEGDAPAHARHGSEEYAALAPLFTELVGLPPGDPRRQTLRDELVAGHLVVAHNIAARFRGRGQSQEDLRQVATLGLIKAIDRFEPAQGTDFLAYAIPTIMGEVRRYFRDESWSVRVPRRLKELHVKLGFANSALIQQLGRAPSARELADHLGLNVEEVYEGLEAASAYQAVSLSEPVTSSSDDVTLDNALGMVDDAFEQIEDRESIQPLLNSLPERERKMLILRFFGNQSQSQIAEQVGISQMQVSRVLAKTLRRLREQLADQA